MYNGRQVSKYRKPSAYQARYQRKTPLYKPVSVYRRGSKRFYSRSSPHSKLTQGEIYKYKRTLDFGNVIFSAASNTYAAYSYKLNDLSNITDWTTLYDNYKITGITMHFIPQQTQDDVTTATNTTGLLHSVIDYDDATTPTAIADLMEFSNWKVTPFNHQLRRYFRPAVAMEVYTGAAAAPSGVTHPWLDCADATIPHYGFKTAMNTVSAGGVGGYRLFVTYYVKFKAVK